MKEDSEILKQMRKEIKEGTIRHRHCDVCGCELAIPNVGVYSRECLNTCSCTVCSRTREESVFLAYVVELRKTHTKPGLLRILEERMTETWGEASIFTIDEWDEQIEDEKYSLCPECGNKMEIENTHFGLFLSCKKCGLGLGCNEYEEIDEQNKESWHEWHKGER